jgi:hypothetical protein
VFGRKPQPPEVTRDSLTVKLDSLRPMGEPMVIAPEEVTGLITLALERLQEGHDAGAAELRAATERLLVQTDAAQGVALRLTKLPPPPDTKE